MVSATKVLNLAKLHRKIQRMPAAAKEQIRAAMEKAAEDIVAMMRSLVPEKTGALKASIGWTWGRAPKGAMTIGKVVGADLGSELTITIYAGTRDKSLGDMDAWHARFVEFGTQHMKARPFFFVSYRANKKRARSRIRRAVRKAAKEVASS